MRLVAKDMSPPPVQKDVEKLGMDHIYFGSNDLEGIFKLDLFLALGIYGIGISLGIFVFCYEFIVKKFESF